MTLVIDSPSRTDDRKPRYYYMMTVVQAMDRKESRGEISPHQLWYRAHKSQYTLVPVKQNNCFFSHHQVVCSVLWLKAGRAPISAREGETHKSEIARCYCLNLPTIPGQSTPSASADSSLNPFQGGSNWSRYPLVMDLLEVIQSFCLVIKVQTQCQSQGLLFEPPNPPRAIHLKC